MAQVIGIPIITLASVTNLPLHQLSASVGRISPILSLMIPCYLTVAFAGGISMVYAHLIPQVMP